MIEKMKNIEAFILCNQAEDLEQGATYKYEDTTNAYKSISDLLEAEIAKSGDEIVKVCLNGDTEAEFPLKITEFTIMGRVSKDTIAHYRNYQSENTQKNVFTLCGDLQSLNNFDWPVHLIWFPVEKKTSTLVRIVRHLWFSEVMDILTESGLSPNPTLLIKNLRQLYGDVFNGYYAMYHLNNFYIMSKEKLKPGKRYEMRVNAYESPYELIHNLPEEEPKEYHFYEIKEVSTEESIRIEDSFRSERPNHYTTKSFEVVYNDNIFNTELYNYHRTAPEWFQHYHMTFMSGKYAPLYINDIGYIPIEISAMAVKALNIPAAIYQVKEDDDIIYNDDIVYKIVTNDTDEIRGAILTNPTLYDAKNLVRRVVDILCNDRNCRIAKIALKIKKNNYRPVDETPKLDSWLR